MSAKPLNRPLSPHLQVWKWTLTMAMSIFHRASGVALVLGMAMLVWMLVAAATGEAAYEQFQHFSTSIFGQLLLLGFTGAIFFHLLSGIRHLLMDSGYLLDIKSTDKASKIILILAFALTFAVWGVLKFSNGGL